MKHLFKKTSLLTALSISMLLSCQKQAGENSVEPDSIKRLGISSEAAQALTCNGYKLAEIKESDGYLVLAPDLVIEKAGFEKEVVKSKGAKTDQYAVNPVGVIDYSRIGTIKYFIHSSVQSIPTHGAGWVNAINQATGNWSSISSVAIRFSAVSDASQADIVFYSDNSSNAGVLPGCLIGLPYNPPSWVFAAAAFPSNGRIGRFISINDDNTQTNDGGKRTVIRHELGHALGFRHADMYQRVGTNEVEPADFQNGCGGPVIGGNLLINTPTRDLNSVMVSASNGVTDIGFDTDDVRAAQLLYPSQTGPAPAIQVNSATYSGSTLNVSIAPYFLAFAQFELRIERRTSCGIYYCYNTVSTRRFAGNQNISWSGASVQSNDRVSVYGVNYKGDYTGPVGGYRNITIN